MSDVTPQKALRMIGTLGILLLVLVVTFATTLLIGAKYKEKVCEQEGGTYSAGDCTPAGEAFNATVDLLAEITTVVGFVGLIVLGAVGWILISMARSYMKGGDGGY